MPKIESLARMIGNVATARVHLEARGPIIGTATILYENGDGDGHFGIVLRLSNKSSLIVRERPKQPGDV